MTTLSLLAALAAGALPVSVAAQSMPGMDPRIDHSHMTMPMPPKPAAKPKPKPVVKAPARASAPAVAKPAARVPVPVQARPPAAPAMDHSTMDHSAMDHSAMEMPAQAPATPVPTPAEPVPDMEMTGMDHSQHGDHAATPGVASDHDMAGMAGMTMGRGGDAYADGSGTSRLPAAEGAMHGLHIMSGNWAFMVHGYAWAAFTDQGGPRGDSEAFVTSMAMLTASRDIGSSAHLQLRSMLSLEPLMGPRGYPNLFATGETADGVNPLLDRQHPHDLFMELSARLDIDAGAGSVFLYAAPVGEPALGPSAFMHRGSAKYQTLSPITHHWFDSTHISYGVVTAGYAAPRWQIEASAFHGREPDQHRWDIEAPALDSWSVRATWSPSPHWSIQASHGFLKSPEQLEAFRNEARTTASIGYATGGLATTVAFSAKNKLPGRTLTAWLAEANWDIDRHHSLFGRAENVANDELFPNPADPLNDQSFRVTKVEGGYAYRLPLVGPFNLALGGSVAGYAYPAALEAAYGRSPISYTLFAKLSMGH